jgi:hypothetical protein
MRAALTAVLLLLERPSVTPEELSKLAAPLTGTELIQARGCVSPFSWKIDLLLAHTCT